MGNLSPKEKSYDLDWMRSPHKGLIGCWQLGVRKKNLPGFHNWNAAKESGKNLRRRAVKGWRLWQKAPSD
jgi:hypothetical protein